jgi:predicted enzyme related to lactoylglutathione lyase
MQKGDIMAGRDRYIAGLPCWVDTSQPDPEAALPFYSGLFGWEFENVMPEGSGGTYYIARIRGGDVAAVTRIADGSPPIATWNTFVWVDNADETADIARKAGGNVVVEPFAVTGAGRTFTIVPGALRASTVGHDALHQEERRPQVDGHVLVEQLLKILSNVQTGLADVI